MQNQKIVPYLMFEGNAEEAMNFYFSVFGSGEILFIQKYGDVEGQFDAPISEEGKNKVIHAHFTLAGQPYFCSDKVDGQQSFQPGSTISLCVNCESADEIEHLYKKLSLNGNIMMELQDTFWDAKYAVIEDKFGLTWQLNFHKNEMK